MSARQKRLRQSKRLVTEINEVTIRLRVEPLEQGGCVATSPDAPGLVAEGRSVTEAVEIAQGLAGKIVSPASNTAKPVLPALTAPRWEHISGW